MAWKRKPRAGGLGPDRSGMKDSRYRPSRILAALRLAILRRMADGCLAEHYRHGQACVPTTDHGVEI